MNNRGIYSDAEIDLFISVSQAIVSVRNKKDLVDFIQLKLKNVFQFSDLAITRFNTSKGTFRVFLDHCDKSNQHPDFDSIAYSEYPIRDGLHDTIMNSETSVVLSVSRLIENGMKHFIFLQDAGIKEVAGIRLQQKGEIIGTMVLLSEEEGSFTESHRRIMENISSQISSAVANIIANEEIQRREHEKAIMLSLSNELAMVRNKDELFTVINDKLKVLFSSINFAIILINEDRKTHSTFLLGIEDSIKNHTSFQNVIDKKYSVNDGVFNAIIGSETEVMFNVDELNGELPLYVPFWKELKIKRVIGIALRVADKDIGCLLLEPKSDIDIEPVRILLKGVCSQIAITLSNIMSNEKNERQLKEIIKYKEQLEEEKSYLQEEITKGHTYNDIIGSGNEMQKVFQLLSQVAFTNSTVLILGETGTGKELIARAIHNSSPRKNNLLVKVNCAALPANLIESELFGHEKGSFTGAVERRIGKFELAHKGTLFLDEIGEMPVELQMKLLRAIQEKEIERLGGKDPIKIDVRIITATNRNLKKEMEEGRFRSDLYYRLNVFPIQLPPLKNRTEDIPELVSHFIAKFNKSIGKEIKSISNNAMSGLLSYPWPGNVRELEHVIERSILMNNGTVIRDVFLPNPQSTEHTGNSTSAHMTMHEYEKECIIGALKKCNGKVYGPTGAAMILGIPHTTLHSKMKKLGITKREIFN